MVMILATLLIPQANGQDYTTPDQYEFRVQSDVPYGVATNYLGLEDTLLLDIYTPNNNDDTERPLMVLVHGGTWLGGCKDDPSGIVPMILQFVKRGYVVASINYRLGWHKAEFVSRNVAGYGISPWPIQYRAFYALDSMEIKRAMYRGQQDAKGAIRFMKGRAAQDSVCVEKVFIGGESAGGFVALATAFMDRDEEKPSACNTLADAPAPYSLFLNATALNCVFDSLTPTEDMLTRPNLGPVEGDLNLNGQDATVKGVVNFYGGVPQEAFELDWWQGVDTPAVYLYHQTPDAVVPFNSGRPYGILSTYCNLGAAPWHPRYPIVSGSGAIKTAFDQMVDPPAHTTEFPSFPPFDPNIALFDCIRMGDNGSYHFTRNHAITGQNVANFFGPYASDFGACMSSGIPVLPGHVQINVHPQPARDLLYVNGLSGPVRILDVAGREQLRIMLRDGQVDASGLADGVYLIMSVDQTQPAIRFSVAH